MITSIGARLAQFVSWWAASLTKDVSSKPTSPASDAISSWSTVTIQDAPVNIAAAAALEAPEHVTKRKFADLSKGQFAVLLGALQASSNPQAQDLGDRLARCEGPSRKLPHFLRHRHADGTWRTYVVGPTWTCGTYGKFRHVLLLGKKNEHLAAKDFRSGQRFLEDMQKIYARASASSIVDDEFARLVYNPDAVASLARKEIISVVHRDLKPENVLFDLRSQDLVPSDFGLGAPLIAGHATGCVGTPGFTAPELLNNEQYTAAVDVFSLGMVAACLALAGGLLPGRGRGKLKAMADFQRVRKLCPKRATDGMCDLSSIGPDVDDVASLQRFAALSADERAIRSGLREWYLQDPELATYVFTKMLAIAPSERDTMAQVAVRFEVDPRAVKATLAKFVPHDRVAGSWRSWRPLAPPTWPRGHEGGTSALTVTTGSHMSKRCSHAARAGRAAPVAAWDRVNSFQ